MQLKKKNRKFSLLAILINFSFIVSGCSSWGDVSQVFRIDKGNEPENQDKMVRFRTTYYFRIVDSCNVNDGISSSSYSPVLETFQVRSEGKLKIVNDSLYRFRMTGKASALFSTIHFESGVLREDQIDPFGSTVKYNPKKGLDRMVSASQLRERARRDAIIDEINKIDELKEELGDDYKEKIKSLIKGQLTLLAIENDSGLSDEKSTNIQCPNGRPIMQSYFLYGPEGVRQLDPDERLIMAMTIDSKPLISMLQQLSGKQIQSQQTHSNSFQKLVVEREKTLDSLAKVKDVKEKNKFKYESLSTLLDDLQSKFKPLDSNKY